MQNYRRSLKENEKRYALAKQKDRERKRKEYLMKKDSVPLNVRRVKEKEKKRKQREKKKQLTKKTSNNKTPEKNEKENVSPQLVGRMYCRARRGLPGSPRKKVRVLAKLVGDLSPMKRRAVVDLCDEAPKRRKLYDEDRKKRSDALTDEEVNTVREFYLRDDISRILPGKKFFISVKKPSGEREHRQKRWLHMSIREAYQVFKSETSIKIGKSKFAELRPAEVIPMSSNNQEVCICKYHENIDLYLRCC